MIVVEWKLTTFLSQEPWLDVPPRTRGVARLRAARGATGDPTRAWWRVQPRLLTQKRGQFLQPTMGLSGHDGLISHCNLHRIPVSAIEEDATKIYHIYWIRKHPYSVSRMADHINGLAYWCNSIVIAVSYDGLMLSQYYENFMLKGKH